MKVGSLFAGIGGFDLGLERAGFEIAWQVEIDPYCQRVLAKHWPAVTRYGDIREVDWHAVEPVDLLCGGFPCQDISLAGKGAGLTGERSGLWFEYAKAIEVLKPRAPLVPLTGGIGSGLLPTPKATEHKGGHSSKGGPSLGMMATHNLWPTPTARDHKDTGANVNWEKAKAKCKLAGAAGGSLNPTWVEWLMGYPIGWTDLEDSATRSSHKSRNGSDGKL